MNRRQTSLRACTILVLVSFSLCGFAQQAKEDPELQKALNQMDTVGRSFRTFTARISQKKYTAVLKEFDTPETGELYVARARDGSTLVRRDIVSPGKSILTIKGGTAVYYQPGIKTAQILDLGKNKDKAEYMDMGIGQSPAKLQETFDISYKGGETLNAVPCSVLYLKPKSPRVAAMFSLITLWISKSSGLPIQDKLEEPSGDYLLWTFFDEKLNPKIPESMFVQNLPSGVDVQRF